METLRNSWSQLWTDLRFNLLDHLPKLLLALVVVLVFAIMARVIRHLYMRFNARIFKRNYLSIQRIMASVIYFSILAIGIFLALHVLGLNKPIEKLLAGAGIIGVIAGFALKDIVANMFSGFLVDMQRPFQVGDWVEINGKYGKVQNISWLATELRSIEGQDIFIPNQIIYNGAFTNYSTGSMRRVVFKSGVSYGDDLEKVRSVAIEEVHRLENYLKDMPVDFYYTEIGGSTYNFMLRFWVRFDKNEDYWSAMHEIIMRIKCRFEKEDISIAYPVTTLDFGVKGGVNLYDQPIELSGKD